MSDPVLTFRLDQSRIDDDLLRWLRSKEPNLETIDQASAEASGFNLKTLMTDVLRGEFAMGADAGKLGPLSTLLEDFGYWLFVGLGRPRVIHPPPFHLKTVTVTATRRDLTYDSRRVVLGVYGGADPVFIPIPAVPELLLPATTPVRFARSRDALVDFAQRCVDRVNIIAPAALHLGALVSAGYPAGGIE